MVNKKMTKKGKCDEGLCEYAKTGCMASVYMQTKTSEQLKKEYGSDNFEVIKYKLPCDPGKEHEKCKFYNLNKAMLPMVRYWNDTVENGTEEDKMLALQTVECLQAGIKDGSLDLYKAFTVTNHFPEVIESLKKKQNKKQSEAV